MAGRMVNLGQVGFGLVADSEALRASLELLKAFGREVDRLSRLTGEASQAMYKKLGVLEPTLTRMFNSAETATRKMRELGASEKDIAKLEKAFRKAHDEVIKFSEDIQPHRVQRAVLGLSQTQERAVAEARSAKRARDEIVRINEEAGRVNARLVQAEMTRMNQQYNEKIQAQTRFSQYAAREREIQQRRDTEAYRMSSAAFAKAEQEKFQVMSNFAKAQAVEQRRIQTESIRQAQILNNQQRALGTLGVRATSAGIDPRFMRQTGAAFAGLQATSIRDAEKWSAAQIRLKNAMALTHQEILRVNGGTSRFAVALRDLERAAILAVGPLSGIGARLAVLSALFESTSFKMALTIGGLAGISIVSGILGVKIIQAGMRMQEFDAILTASTGSAALVADEYSNVLELSKKWGFNVQGLVEPYAKFTAAARLSNVPLEQQRKMFEAVIISSRALQLDTQRTNLIFLAFEQMLSKGTVTMEELRRQLGDLLPGAFAVAARAMGMSQIQFNKAITNGEILAKDLLPKLSEALIQMYGTAAQKAAVTAAAEMEKFRTSVFELFNAFERSTGATKLWADLVRSATSAVDALARNVHNVIGAIGALTGAAVMGLLVSQWGLLVRLFTAFSFANIARGIATITGAVFGLTGAVAGLDVAIMASGVGAVVSALAKLGAIAIGAAAGFYLMRPAAEDANAGFREFINQTKQWLELQKLMGPAAQSTVEMQKEAINKRLALLKKESDDLKTLIQERTKLTGTQEQRAEQFGRSSKFVVAPQDSPEVKAARERLQVLSGLETEFRHLWAQVDATARQKDETGGVESTVWANFVDKVKKDIREFEYLDKELKAAPLGETAMAQTRAMKEALDLVATMPEKVKDRGSLDPLIAALGKLGFYGESQAIGAVGNDVKYFTEQLAAMFLEVERRKKEIKDIEAMPGKLESVGKSLQEVFQALEDRRIAATGADPERLAQEKALQGQISRVQELGETLKKVGVTQEQINYLVEEYKRRWTDVEGLERHAKTIKNLRQDIERLENRIGGRSSRVMERLRDDARTISEAFNEGVIGHEKALEMLATVNDDAYREILGRATLFGRELQAVMREAEDSLTKALVDPLFGVKNSWQEFFNSLLRMVLEFLAKMAVVQPVMTVLFGDLYTQKAGTGKGLLGGVISGMAGGIGEKFMRSFLDPYAGQSVMAGYDALIGGSTAVNTATSFGLEELFASFAGMGFQHGGSFAVGGTGGTDSQVVAFRATPGERVSVTPPGGVGVAGGGGGQISIIVNVNNQSGTPVEATAKPRMSDSGEVVLDLVLNRLSRDAGARDSMRALLRPPAH